MRNISTALCGISIIAVSFLASCDSKTKPDAAPAAAAAAPASADGATGGKIAYVNIDSLEANYELLKTKRDEFKKRQDEMEAQLQSAYQLMQNDAAEVQKKAQANTLTQDEYEAANKRLMQEQKSLETRKQTLTDQLMKEQEDFNRDLKSRLDAFLAEYNKTHHYDYILSYSASGSSLLYVNKQLDITKDVVDGMNAASKSDANKK